MTLPPSSAEAHLVVGDLDRPQLTPDAAHHLHRVRRIRPGTDVTATDGDGRWRWCRVTGDDELETVGDVVVLARPAPELTIAFALTKAGKPELTVQKLTELGVDRIIPFRAARSVVRWDETKAEANRSRWQAIAVAAVEQSRGCWVPRIDEVVDVAGLAAMGAVRTDRDGVPPSLGHPVVAVGPEGGWDDHERAQLPMAVSLGANVLRAETAALTAGGVLTALRSGLVAQPG